MTMADDPEPKEDCCSRLGSKLASVALFDNAGLPVFPGLPGREDPRVRDFLGAAEDEPVHPVVIVGAGVAGVFAARALDHMGIGNYLVLEASDRIGGRLKDTSTGGNGNGNGKPFLNGAVPLDLGAEWIHTPNGREAVTHMLDVFSDDSSLPAAATPSPLLEDSNFVAYNPSFWFQKRELGIFKKVYQETKWNRSTWNQYLDECLVKASPNLAKNLRLEAPVVGISYGASTSSSSSTTTTTTRKRITLEVLAKDGTTVDKVVASRVICTIPLAVLKTKAAAGAGTPQSGEGANERAFFDPPLSPSKTMAIERVPMPPGYRILFEMGARFYPDLTSCEALGSSLWSGRLLVGDLALLYDAMYGKDKRDEHHVLAFVAVGEHHAALSVPEAGDGNGNGNNSHHAALEDLLVRDALARIDELFDGNGTRHYKSHTIQNWTTEPYIGGAYTFPNHSRSDSEALAASEWDGSLLFAGEHTSVKYYSLVHGAAIEGVRAAVEAVVV